MKILKVAAFIVVFFIFSAKSTFADVQNLQRSPRLDISQLDISSNMSSAQVGQDVNFTVTIQNNSRYKKFVSAICFQSNEGNFGCSQGVNLSVGQIYNINNSGRFTSGGTKNIWITWTQDDTNYYLPLNSKSANIFIYQ
jgi:hypothetical protein